MSTAVPLALCLSVMLGSFFGICRVDRRAIPGALALAALLVSAAAYVAALLAL